MPRPVGASLRSLTARERDCLNLLRSGLTTREAAAALGIRPATLNKHLASARHKLGVSRTAHALLMLRPEPADRFVSPLGAPGDHDRIRQLMQGSDDFERLARTLRGCASLDEAWSAVKVSVGKLGITGLKFGIAVDPATSGLCGTTVDDDDAAGTDNPSRLEFALPLAGGAGGAMLSATFMAGEDGTVDLVGDRDLRDWLEATARLFADTIQQAGLLADLAGLTERQRQLLRLAAQGCSIREMSGEAGISMRTVEQELAAARKKLGARTTAAAVYRAMAYRALG